MEGQQVLLETNPTRKQVSALDLPSQEVVVRICCRCLGAKSLIYTTNVVFFTPRPMWCSSGMKKTTLVKTLYDFAPRHLQQVRTAISYYVRLNKQQPTKKASCCRTPSTLLLDLPLLIMVGHQQLQILYKVTHFACCIKVTNAVSCLLRLSGHYILDQGCKVRPFL